MSTTERVLNWRHRPLSASVTLVIVALAVVFGASGCTNTKGAQQSGSQNGSTEATAGMSAHMSGAPVTVYVSQAVVDQRKPAPWDLTTPQSAVRSYLAWVSYAYRIGNSQVATPTMGANEEVRMDSYCQFNLEKKRLLDEKLDSIKFGTVKKAAKGTLVPVEESWTYSYLSVDKGNPVLEGPYKIEYTSVYKVVKNGAGWVVDSVQATASGTVK